MVESKLFHNVIAKMKTNSCNKSYFITVILTCFNRKAFTLRSLQSMYDAVETYNTQTCEHPISVAVYITDDGCTDGTSDAVRETFKDKDITIIQGNGSLFWAGGMRVAWKAALANRPESDFFLLMNDDTFFRPNALIELFNVHKYVMKIWGKAGIYSGVCSSTDGREITYGGSVYKKPLIGRAQMILPDGKPQRCQLTNANILLVAQNVVEGIGIFDEAYQHGCADWAYGMEANKAGFAVYVTANVCGLCDNDHDTESAEREKIINMTIAQRKAFFQHPLHSTHDVLYYMKRYQKLKCLPLLIARFLNIYMPKVYYGLSKLR